MKKRYLLVLLGCCLSANAQIISIPDPIFKAELLAANPDDGYTASNINGEYITIDTNGDGEIQTAEALQVYELFLVQPCSDLTGIKGFTNLITLDCSYLALESLDVSTMVNLENINCSDNFISTINVSGCMALYTLQCDFNEITALNLTGLPNIHQVICGSNAITSIDLSGLSSLEFFSAPLNDMESITLANCPNLSFLQLAFNSLTSLDLSGCHPGEADIQENYITQLVIKNGFDDSDAYIDFYNNPLQYICADEVEFEAYETSLLLNGITNGEVNSYCSLTPGGNFYTLQGINNFNPSNNSCTNTNPYYPGLKFSISDSTSTIGSYIADASGNYSISLPFGSYTISPVLENPNFFMVTPASIAIPFPSPVNPIEQNFCITPNGVHPDLEVSFLPLTASVPGFNPEYRIIYHNKGNQTQSGTISLTFENNVLSLLTSNPPAIQTGNTLTWSFSNLMPSQSRSINLEMHLNTPTDTPAVNIDDQLDFTATILAPGTDETVADNTDVHQEIVVGSFDPNDKTCLEGTVVSPTIVGDYVNYIIRFENTGTYPATNIVVMDRIDLAKFDIATLQPTGGSHNYVTRISDGNKVEFVFEGINLPFDDANNDGFVSFKIKTKSTLVVGNTFSNTASIYFDYNAPIVTNTATTTIQLLGTPDFEFGDYFTLAPNPAKDFLAIHSSSYVAISSVNIYNTFGQLVLVASESSNQIDVSGLKTGNYFIKIISDKGTSSSKFLKE
jgi:hypothetical protein